MKGDAKWVSQLGEQIQSDYHPTMEQVWFLAVINHLTVTRCGATRCTRP